jgi:hypothetical protein
MSDSEIDIEEYMKLVIPPPSPPPPPPSPKILPKAKEKNKWMKHVQEYRKQNPDVKYTECLKQAKLTYNKT